MPKKLPESKKKLKIRLELIKRESELRIGLRLKLNVSMPRR